MRFFYRSLFIPLFLLFIHPGFSQEPLTIGDVVGTEISTAHPYNPDGQKGIIFEKKFHSPNSAYIKFHFKDFQLGGDDHLEISAPNTGQSFIYAGGGKLVDGGTRTISDFWSLSILDDTAVVRLYSQGAGSSSHGFQIDKVAYGFPQDSILALQQQQYEAICGTDDKEEIECYSGTTMFDKGEAVCRVVIGGAGLCTGWLLGSEGHVMTNNHCIGDNTEAQNSEFQFDFKYSNCSATGTPTQDIVANTSTLICTDQALDYTLVKLPTDPTNTYGYLSFEPDPPVVGERIYIPQHPGGSPKKISVDDDQTASGFGEVQNINGGFNGTRVEYYTDTEGGSSGSPVLAYDEDNVLALHNTGGCLNGGNQNDAIIADMGLCMPDRGVDDSSYVLAGFDVDPVNSCDSTIQFTDLSSNAFNWTWDLGDGSSSSLQNPSHDYSSSGTYTVQLVVGNGNGFTDTATKQVSVSLLDTPNVSSPDTVCHGMAADLQASNSNGILQWAKDTTQPPIDTGSSVMSSALFASTDFFVRTLEGGAPPHKVGPTNNNIFTGEYFDANDSWGCYFDVQVPILLRSVLVYSDQGATRAIQLLHQGNVIASKNVYIGNGTQRVDLDFEVPSGNQYLLKVTGNTVDLFRNDGGANYPYTEPGLMSITGNNTTSGTADDYYYYFYDWEVKRLECKSEWKKVHVEVLEDSIELSGSTTPSGGSCQGSATVDVFEGVPPYSYQWDDPNASTSQSIDDLCAGTYTVTVIDDKGCEDSLTLEVFQDSATAVREHGAAKEFELRPLPVRDRLILEMPTEWQEQGTEARLYDMLGERVRNFSLSAGRGVHSLDLGSLRQGVYILDLRQENGRRQQFKVPITDR